jgi:hypothetical protein
MGALVVQYLLGMYVNLFVPFPENATEGQLWAFSWSQPALAAHIVLAFLLSLGAIILCIRSVRSKSRVWIWSSFIGLIALLAAGFSGSRFIPTQTDAYSYSMALWFIAAFASYGWGAYASGKE